VLCKVLTFNRGLWQIPQKEVVEKYGYVDKDNRKALYNTIYVGKQNSQGLTLTIDKKNNQVKLTHKPTKKIVAVWSIYTIVGKFISKLERTIFVFAQTRLDKHDKEEFYFDEAYLLEQPSPDKFMKAFGKSLIAIDIRMYLKESGALRNHRTGLRIFEKDMLQLYGKRRQLI